MVYLFASTVKVQESFIPAVTRTQNRISRNIRLSKDNATNSFNEFYRKAKRGLLNKTGILNYLK